MFCRPLHLTLIGIVLWLPQLAPPELLTLGFSGGFIKPAALVQKSGDAVEQHLPRSVGLDIASQTGVTPEVQAQIVYVHAKENHPQIAVGLCKPLGCKPGYSLINVQQTVCTARRA